MHEPPSFRRIAMIGAGIGGLRCAAILAEHGVDVTVFDKARGPGGRMSSRRAPQPFGYDHGAQFFTARDPRFRQQVCAWVRAGVATQWRGRLVEIDGAQVAPLDDDQERYVGVPRMSAIGRHMAIGLDLRLESRIAHLERGAEGWHLTDVDNQNRGAFDAVLINAPPRQACDLLSSASPDLAARVGAAQMAPCVAVLAGWHDRLPISFDGAFVRGAELSWVARNSSKPGRDRSEAWVLHAGPAWSRDHFDTPAETSGPALLAAFASTVGRPLPPPDHLDVHRWAYAQVERPIGEPCLFDGAQALGACGDWCADGRVEGAFLSGQALADAVLAAE